MGDPAEGRRWNRLEGGMSFEGLAVCCRGSAVLLVLVVASMSPVRADQHRGHANPAQGAQNDSLHLTCETVRAYVSLVGLEQAKAMARAKGMTAAQEWRARQCLAKRD
jgi:hypothetical protein